MPDTEIMMIKESLTDIKTGVARIETKIDAQGDTISDHEDRLRALEGKAGKRWDSVVSAISSAVLVGVVGFVLGKLL